jgi:hypothetical protein
VLYARAETGVALFGAAGGWWAQADGRYQRGRAPEVGAILVFKRSSRIPSGHVAVVAKVVSANEILVDHANWYPGRVNRGMAVIDTSPGHDWSSVAVVDLSSGKPGRDYPTYGFIYPSSGPREIVEARYGGQLDKDVADSWRSLDSGASGISSCRLCQGRAATRQQHCIIDGRHSAPPKRDGTPPPRDEHARYHAFARADTILMDRP